MLGKTVKMASYYGWRGTKDQSAESGMIYVHVGTYSINSKAWSFKCITEGRLAPESMKRRRRSLCITYTREHRGGIGLNRNVVEILSSDSFGSGAINRTFSAMVTI